MFFCNAENNTWTSVKSVLATIPTELHTRLLAMKFFYEILCCWNFEGKILQAVLKGLFCRQKIHTTILSVLRECRVNFVSVRRAVCDLLSPTSRRKSWIFKDVLHIFLFFLRKAIYINDPTYLKTFFRNDINDTSTSGINLLSISQKIILSAVF